jgi:LacI family transcriptional regulator
MPETRRTRVKMADVARESGVSLSTVSMVLADKPGLPSETRQRVLSVAHALGYRSKAAGNLDATGALKTVRMFLKNQRGEMPRANEFYSHVISGIEAACGQRKIDLMYTTIEVDDNSVPVEIPDLLAREDADGLIFVGIFVNETLSLALDRTGLPLVLIDGYSANRKYDSVVTDNFSGAYQATQYLISKGHTHIGFLGGHEQYRVYPSFEERSRGYMQAIQDYNLPGPYFVDCAPVRDQAYSAALHLLQVDPQITAITGCNDFVVITAMHAALSMGLRIPQDVSTVGFDDIFMAENVMPPLTTMRIDKINMGRLGVQLLVNRAEVPEASVVTTQILPSLVERFSVAELKSELKIITDSIPSQDPV